MNYNNTNNRKNITQTPESFNIEPIDFLVVDGIGGTSVICFDNIVFDIEQMAFEEEFNQHTTDIISVSSTITSIHNDLSSFIDREVEKITSGINDVVKRLEEAQN